MQVSFYRGTEIVKSIEVETAEDVFNCLPKEVLRNGFGETKEEVKEIMLRDIEYAMEGNNGGDSTLFEATAAFPNLQEEGLEGVDCICIEEWPPII
jgi:hypothetical protein